MHATRLALAARSKAVTVVALAALALASACTGSARDADRNDRVALAYLDNYEAMVRALEQVDDEASARDAAAKIRRLKAEMTRLSGSLAGKSRDYQERFSKKFGARFSLLREKMAEERRRIASLPAVDAAFQEAMRLEADVAGS